jgi:hypothetical protein
MIASILSLLTAIAGAPQAQIGEQRIYGDWAVGCDNGLACEAFALDPVASFGSASGSLTFRRGAGRDGYLRAGIRMYADTDGEQIGLYIDGALSGLATRSGTDSLYHFAPETAAELARRAARGRSAEIFDAQGGTLGQISLTGSHAALRHVDDRQGRAGSRSALVATGSRISVRSAPELPVIVAMPVPGQEDREVQPIAQDEAAGLREQSECLEPNARRNEAFAISHDTVLHLISCEGGAYNFGDMAFVTQNGIRRPAEFDAPTGWGETVGPAVLVNAWWNPEEGALGTYAKGRGIGDCGTAQRFVWDGSSFRLVEQREMNDCRGSIHWITVYRANVRWMNP